VPAHAAKTASLLSGRAVVVIRPRARRQDRPPTSRDCVGRMTGHATRRRLRRPQAETAQMMLYNRLFERSFCGFELFALPRTAWHAGSAEFCTARKTSGVLKSTTTRYSAPELAACGGGPPPILRSVCEPPSPPADTEGAAGGGIQVPIAAPDPSHIRELSRCRRGDLASFPVWSTPGKAPVPAITASPAVRYDASISAWA